MLPFTHHAALAAVHSGLVGPPPDLGRSVLDLSVLSGALPTTLTLAGAAALGCLLIGPSGRWWRVLMPTAAAAALVVVLAADLALWVWRPFPDPLPIRVLVWAGVGALGLTLTVAHLAYPASKPRSIRRAAGCVVAMLVIIALSATKINALYGYRPTLGAALGVFPVQQTNFAALTETQPTLASSPRPLAQSWTPPANLPALGELTSAPIPGTRSGFHARAAWIYLPPAYLVSPRPLLPVLMLLAGQPGAPRDWIIAGRLVSLIDTFAAQHAGLAPIVVVPDATGSPLGNPLCLDSRLGNAASYLSKDVPTWIRSHLQVDPNTAHWAVGGFSYGGTCALQLAVTQAQLFPTFLDISGQQEPTLGSYTRTVQEAYNGNQNQLQSVEPMNILAHERFPATLGILAVGGSDDEYAPQALHVAAACQHAGMQVQLTQYPGGHSWMIASDALRAALPTIAARGHLIKP